MFTILNCPVTVISKGKVNMLSLPSYLIEDNTMGATIGRYVLNFIEESNMKVDERIEVEDPTHRFSIIKYKKNAYIFSFVPKPWPYTLTHTFKGDPKFDAVECAEARERWAYAISHMGEGPPTPDLWKTAYALISPPS
jgi:hypothetical protein